MWHKDQRTACVCINTYNLVYQEGIPQIDAVLLPKDPDTTNEEKIDEANEAGKDYCSKY